MSQTTFLRGTLYRVAASGVGLPILLVLMYFGGWPLALTILSIGIMGQWELYRCFSGKRGDFIIMAASMVVSVFLVIVLSLSSNADIHPFFMYYSSALFYTVTMPIGLVISAFLFIRGLKAKKLTAAILFLFGFFYITFPLLAIVLMREGLGLYFVWLIFIAAWGSDTGAYFIGIGFGKRKLSPRLSPKKTIVGAVGGLVTAAVFSSLYAFILNNSGIWEFSGIVTGLFPFALYGLIGSFLGQTGDLIASAIKRHAGIKDFGRIIPGHGGVLDRFDSILFVAPFALIFFYFIM
jgi:phosphatidate cytidylyltransferase